MLDLSIFLSPVNPQLADEYVNRKNSFGSIITKYAVEGNFPDIEGYQIALIGAGEERGSVHNDGTGDAPHIVRQKFYELKVGGYPYRIADLGNLKPGKTLEDSYAAIAEILVELRRMNILPI